MTSFHLNRYPYSSGRTVIMGKRGAVATSQPQATLAGMEMLLAGGNAVDAAVSMAIALTVLEPISNGIGADAFALVWDGQVQGLNGSGLSPQALTSERLQGLTEIPPWGWMPVTVPGAVSAWRSAWERWGRLPFEQLFAPAIRYASEGFAVSPEIARLWKHAESMYLPLEGAEFEPFKEVFFKRGRAPKAGEIWSSPVHAQTLQEIAATGGESFYRGALAEKMAAFAEATGGLLSATDLATHQALWVDPISTTYRDQVTVWEIPPNGQGIAALMALNILEGEEIGRFPRESAQAYHWQLEAMKLAFADAHHYVADPRFMEVSPTELLSKDYAARRRGLITERALPRTDPGFPKGETVYLAAADGELMISFIQSTFEAFGSGVLIPQTGIALQNRGLGFTLQPGHPNQAGPSKRPFHTIIPGFLTRDGRPWGPFGVMGGPMQPQGHLQMVVNMVDYGLNPQAALDAPRWQVLEDNKIYLEQSVPQSIALELSELGHQVEMVADPQTFGRGQIILKEGETLIAGSEPRMDGMALAY